jgi:ribosome biogenesis GTPase A
LRWFRVSPTLELMDTPGILVPKIPTADAQWMLAITGALPRERYDPIDVATRFADWAAVAVPALAVPSLDAFARARGFVRRGEEIDEHNAAGAYLRAFHEGKFGRITFEEPPAA